MATFFAKLLRGQAQQLNTYELSRQDQRHIQSRTVVRTPQGELEVEVPERENEEVSEFATESSKSDVRQSHKIQAKIAQIGVAMGFDVWMPANDRNIVSENVSDDVKARLITQLPINFDVTTVRTIENIDVLWLQGRRIVRAFEVEHTTAIYSGLLRMADLLALQPNIDIRLHIVSDEIKRDKVRKEILRPVFRLLQGGAMGEKCSFLSYESIDAILGVNAGEKARQKPER